MKGYKVCDPNHEEGHIVVVIAEDAKEAKKLAYGHDCLAYCEYKDIRVKWLKTMDTKGLEKGEIDYRVGLKLGVYDWIENFECEECGIEGRCSLSNDKLVCECCKGEKDV